MREKKKSMQHLGASGVHGRIILKWIRQNKAGKMSARLKWVGRGLNGEIF
jgi:hypothetical protein